MSRRKNGEKVSQSNTIETKVATILESMNVPFEQQVAIDRYTVDFLVDKKYIVECYGDFCIALYNGTDSLVHIAPGEKIAQLVLIPTVNFEVTEVDEVVSADQRGDGGFGSTGN